MASNWMAEYLRPVCVQLGTAASIVVMAFACVACSCNRAAAYTPDDPVVLAMVDKGIAFLEKADFKDVSGEFVGGKVLVGYAVYKVTGDKDHPLVKKGLEDAIKCAADTQTRAETISKIVYDASISAIFLADLDATLYRPQLIQIRDFLRYAQKKNGGFGYLGSNTGDTSQTQYAMLAMWALSRNDVTIPEDMIEACLRYLLATQDPSGAWGYQATVSTTGQPVAQEGVSKSLATAGIGATLIGTDLVGLLGKRSLAEDDPDIPKAFTRIDLIEKEREKKSSSSFKLDEIRPSIDRAVSYQTKSPFMATGAKGWYFYYRYSEERYESFLEVLNSKTKDKSPAWYNAGVNELKKMQDRDGSWGRNSGDFCPVEVCTAFSILYLIRSTQKTIAKLNEGFTIGGYGLPKNAATIKRVGDKIVSEETASVEGLLEMMEKTGTENVEVGLLPENLTLSKNPVERKAQVTRLSRLLRSEDWKSRRIAAKLLGRCEDINQVPELIYALTDKDPLVPMIAEESLRLLTRKLTVRNLEAEATPEQKDEAARFWRKWYISVRPDYVFLDK